MRISAKVTYGLRALLDLAEHAEQGPLLSRDIARRQAIPETYLNQLVLQLRRASLITSLRGPRGGHMLALAPDAITVLHIFEALEGPLVVVPENSDAARVAADGVLDNVWSELRVVMRDALAQVTLAQLQERLRTTNGEFSYEI